MAIIKLANLAVAFLLELCALGAFGYWGFTIGQGWLVKIALGIGTPLLAAVLWGIFMAPRASMPVSQPLHLFLELVFFGLAIGALYTTGQATLAWTFGLVFVVNHILLYVWKQ